MSGLRKEHFETPSGIEVDAVYGGDVGGAPGAFPFTRGIDPQLYRESPWIMGMYSGYATPEETNQRFHALLAKGQTGLSVALDLPTQLGLDPDDPRALGEVGKVGVPISSLRDMELLFDGIDLRRIRQIRTSANAIGPIMTALFIAVAERHGLSATNIRVMLQNDSLKEYVARGTYIFPPRYGLEFSADVIEYCARNVGNWEPIEFCGYHIRDSGCTAVQEVAIAFSNGIAYIEETLARGIAIDDFAPSLVAFLSADIYLLEEVAKFRAARRVWANLMRERFGARRPESWRLPIFCYTLGGSLIAQEPLNNVVRVAYMTLAAALGGVQTLATSSYDEALRLPSDEAAAIALRTQQICAYETGVTDSVDPLGGSYQLEAFTDDLEAKILDEMGRVEQIGGAVAAIDDDYYRSVIEESAYEQHRAIETGELAKVGLNMFGADGSAPAEERTGGLRGDPHLEQRQADSVREVRRTRDSTAATRALREVETVAKRDGNLVEPILDAVRSYVTLGEICATLRQVWGEHRTPLATL